MVHHLKHRKLLDSVVAAELEQVEDVVPASMLHIVK